jgi:predicted dinucleotide-binding enzyme
MVGHAIATKLVHLGHDVMMGSRSATNEKAKGWATSVKGEGQVGTFAEAAQHGEVLVNCTRGTASIDVLHSCDREVLRGKVLVDTSNPLDFSKGYPPSLTVCNTDSMAEQIQRTFPWLRVVKALNTITAPVMVEPSLVPGEHNTFICGNDAEAKEFVTDLLASFDWPRHLIIDVGDVTCARALEMMLPIWVRLAGVLQSPFFNFHIVRQDRPY